MWLERDARRSSNEWMTNVRIDLTQWNVQRRLWPNFVYLFFFLLLEFVEFVAVAISICIQLAALHPRPICKSNRTCAQVQRIRILYRNERTESYRIYWPVPMNLSWFVDCVRPSMANSINCNLFKVAFVLTKLKTNQRSWNRKVSPKRIEWIELSRRLSPKIEIIDDIRPVCVFPTAQ